MSEKEDLKEARDIFDTICHEWSEQRQAFASDMKFARLGEQWPAIIMEQRRLDQRPCLTINRLPAFIRQVVNDARMNKPAIKVRPADSKADIKTAAIYDGIIRNIESVSKAPIAYDTAVDCAVSGGFGFWTVDIEYVNDFNFDKELRINRIANPLTVYFDAYTTAADSADWNNAFVADDMPTKQFQAQFPGYDASPFDDDSKDNPWRNKGEDTTRVAVWWNRSEVERTVLLLSNNEIVYAEALEDPTTRAIFDAAGITVVQERLVPSFKVKRRLITGTDIIEDTPWAGKFIPIIPVYGEDLNVEGKRHLRSLVRDGKDAQTNYNFWRTSTAELVALAPKAPWVGPVGAFETDADKWATANTRNHAFLEYDITEGGVEHRPRREPFDGVPAGAMQEALNASDDMKAIFGLYDASLGARSNETSGVAITRRKQEGDVSTFHFQDNLNRAIEHTGRVLVDLIPHVYKGSQVLRILGEDGKAQSVKVNEPFDDNGVTRIYDLGVGRYDVVVQSGPSFTTKREETAMQMIEVIRAVPAMAPVMIDELARNMDWPGAEKIAARLERMIPPEVRDGPPPPPPPGTPPPVPPAIQEMQAKTAAEIEAENAKCKAEIERDDKKAAAQRENERLKALAAARTAREVAYIEANTQRLLQGLPPIPVPPGDPGVMPAPPGAMTFAIPPAPMAPQQPQI